MADELPARDTPPADINETAIARKYGVRELSYPNATHIEELMSFIGESMANNRCASVPREALEAMLEFVQGTVNRQNITKGPRMAQEEFDTLQAPYYMAARIVSKIAREKRELARDRSKLYETTYVTLNQFIDVLRALLDPNCYFRSSRLPESVREVLEVLRDFVQAYGQSRARG